MKLQLWIGLLIIGILLGLWTTFRVYTEGFSLYAKTDVLVWTLPLSTYIFFSLTSAGLAFVSSIPVVFGIKRYEAIEKRTVYLEIAVLIASFVCLILHLGSPLKVFYIILSPNPSSPLWWLAMLYSFYFVILLSAFLENSHRQNEQTPRGINFYNCHFHIHNPWLAAGNDRCAPNFECIVFFVLFPAYWICFRDGCRHFVQCGEHASLATRNTRWEK